MQKVFTYTKIGIGEELEFNGDPNDLLGRGDCVDLWNERTRNGLGTEMIYGWAKITQVITPNFYKAV